MTTEIKTLSARSAAQVVEISEIHPSVYKLTVKLADQAEIETVCRVVEERTSEQETVDAIYFESDDFQRKIMMGEIEMRGLRDAILRFRNEHI